MAPFRLAMLGMWHSHAGGIVTRVADHPKEFELVGFYDPDSKVLQERRSEWAPKLPYFRVGTTCRRPLAVKGCLGTPRQ